MALNVSRAKKLLANYWSLCLIILALEDYSAFGQANVVPPTPNAMKMTEYYAQRPNMYTGTANVNIPLYTFDFDGWSLPLSISYNATGIRTNEEASEVGLGWALNATGVISRTIKGSDDLFPGNGMGPIGYVYSNQALTYSLGYTMEQELAGVIPDPTSYYFQLSQEPVDTQPDIFNFNFFGYNGSFVLSQKVADPNHVINTIKITQNACSISFTESTQTTPAFFIIITPDGYKGVFSVQEISTTFTSYPTSYDVSQNRCWGENYIDITSSQNQGQFRATSSWYLKTIASPHGQVITFSYDLNPDGVTSPYVSNSRSNAEVDVITSPSVVTQTVHEHVYLKNILSEEVNVTFSMETREDLRINTLYTSAVSGSYFPPGSPLKRYNGINIKGVDVASTFNKTITFRQNYFNQQYQDQLSGNQNEKELLWLRGRLDRIIIDDQEYNFYYDSGSNGVPSKLTYGIDHFGFYNGYDQNTMLLPPISTTGAFSGSGYYPADTSKVESYAQRNERKVDFNFGKAGLLIKVKYPTRGYTAFAYEMNTYLPDTSIPFTEQGGDGGGARISSINEYDYNDNLLLSKSYKYVDDPTSRRSASTGKLMTPLYNRYAQLFHSPSPPYGVTSVLNFLYKTFSTIPGNNSAEGKVIGYSKVHEIVNGKNEYYRNTYYFENRPNKILKFNSVAVGYPNLNGQSMEVRNYNSTGNIIQRIVNLDYYHPIDDIKTIVYERKPNSLWVKYYVFVNVTRTFNTPYTVVTTVLDQQGSTNENMDGSITYSGTIQQATKKTSYDKNYLLKYERSVDSAGDSIVKQYKRPWDYTTASTATALKHMRLTTINMVNPVIEEITTKNGIVTSANGNLFNFDSLNNKVNLVGTFSYNRNLLGNFLASNNDGNNFLTPYELRTNFTSYDPVSGKLQEYTSSDGVPHSFIWGYNGILPIVQGVGVKYDQLLRAHNTATLNSSTYEIALRNDPTLIGKQVTTFAHNPLVGLSRVTDPAGLTKAFQYDAYSRLQKVLDHNGYTLEQYQYHFRERQPTRIQSLSGSLDFGTLTPDMYSPKFIVQYVKCSDALLSKILTISNSGEDDLNVSSLTLPAGFISSWNGGTITAGTCVKAIITFDNSQPFGNYSGNITVNSNLSSGVTAIPINAVYSNRVNAITFPSVMDFGIVTSSHNSTTITITNTGNAPLRLLGLPFNWDGNTGGVYTAYTDPNFMIAVEPTCIGGGSSFSQSLTLQINFNPTGDGTMSTKLSLIFDDGTVFKDAILLKGDKRPLNFSEIMGISSSSLQMDAFDLASFTSKPITISNSGTWPLTISGVTSNNPMFTVSSNIFPLILLANNGQQNVTVTFTPTAFNFNPQNAILTFNSDMTGGTNTINVSGQRTSQRTLQLSVNALYFNGPTFTPQNITITNTGNDYLTISDITNLYTSDWSASLATKPITLSPSQNTSMSLMQKVPSPQQPVSISVVTNKNAGNEVVQLTAATRNFNTSTASIVFPSFSSASISQSVTITNSGNSTLNVIGVSSSPTNAMFSVLPSSFTIAANGGQQNVTITFTPAAYNFDPQSTKLLFNSDATNGTSSITVTGQRTSQRTLQLSTNALYFNGPTFTPQNITITNTGNDYLTISDITNGYTTDWSASLNTRPITLYAGQNTVMSVMQKVPSPQQPVSISVVSNKNAGNEVVQLTAATRNFNTSLASIVFPPFSSGSISQSMTITNSGNSPLNIAGVSSSPTNAMFSVLPNSFSIAANGGQQNVTITFTPTAYNFNLQGTTLLFNSDATNGTSAITVTGQRTELRTIQLSSNSLVFNLTGQQQTVTITNTGNNYLNVTGVTYPSTPNWSASINAANLSPGQSTTMTIVRLVGQAENISFSVVSNKNGGNEVVQAGANTRTIGVSPTSFTLPAFSGTSVTQNITVGNSGNTVLSVNNVSTTNSMFTVYPSLFSVPVGGQQTVTVTFAPALNFSQQTATLTFNSDATSGYGMTTVTGQRTSLRTIQLSVNALAFNGPTFSPQNVTVSNVGNDYLAISGVSNPNTTDWSATITPLTLSPGQNTNLSIMKKSPNPQQPLSVSVASNKNGGNEVVQLTAMTKIISLSNVTFSSFTGTTSSQNMTITNSGNTTMSVSSISSTNAKFSISPGALTISPNSSQNVTITYTPQDFSVQSATITVNSDMISGTNTLTISAQRGQLYQVTLSTNSLSVKPSNQNPTSYVTNTGNVAATVNSITNSATNYFTTTNKHLSGGIMIAPTTFPFTLQPGQQLEIDATTATNGTFSSATGTLTINLSNGTYQTIGLIRSTF